MSLTSWLKGRTNGVEEFTKIIKNVTPAANEFITLSGNTHPEYKMFVPYGLRNPNFAGYVGTAFDYLARFRIARIIKEEKAIQSLVAATGFRRLLFHSLSDTKIPDLKMEQYKEMLDPVIEYINGTSDSSIDLLIPIAVRLAFLENIARGSMDVRKVEIQKLLHNSPKEEIEKELKGLLQTFEERFVISEIINENSIVKFNPHFGIAGSLVDGADADIFIDGTLYDFKTSKSRGYSWLDGAQLIGYYLLNELSMRLDTEMVGDYTFDNYMDINRLALYKARFGEVEYYKLSDIPQPVIDETIQKMAAFFADKTAKLGMMHLDIDLDQLKYELILMGNNLEKHR